MTPTREELKNGWTAQTLAAYRAERDRAPQLVPGNVVTPFQKPKPVMQIENTKSFSPLKWGRA